MNKINNIGKTIEDNIMLILGWVELIFFCIEAFILKDVLMAIMFSTMMWGTLILNALYRVERKIDKSNSIMKWDFDNEVITWENIED